MDRLEERGYLRRLPDPEDRRSLLVELTESGYELVEAAASTHFRIMEHLTEGLTYDETESLEGLLKKLLIDIELSSGR